MKQIIIFTALFMLMGGIALAQTNLKCTEAGTLTWDANIETDVAGYTVYWGTSPMATTPYSNLVGVGLTSTPADPTYVLSGLGPLPEVLLYFGVTASDTSGNESGFSNEDSCFFDQVTGDTTPPGDPSNLGITP